MKSKVRFRKIAFVRGHKNDQKRKLTLTFSPQRQTPALHVIDVPAKQTSRLMQNQSFVNA